jgi:hypothetical protein
MISSSADSEFVQMLSSFIEGKEASRGTIFVRQIEGEFSRLCLDDEEEFSDFQHELSMYQGSKDDIRRLKEEASFVLRRLATRKAPIPPSPQRR